MHKSIPVTLAFASAAMLAGCGMMSRGTTTSRPAVVTPAPAPAPTQMATPAPAPAPAPAVAAVPAVPAPAPAPAAPATTLSTADQEFVAIAAGAGMYEAEAARLAVGRARNAQVRSYAQMLLDHHTSHNGELARLVGTKGARITQTMPPALQQRLDALSRLAGAEFDREFIRLTGVQDHTSAVAAFDRARTSVNDADLRAFIERSLPVLRQHLQDARSLSTQRRR